MVKKELQTRHSSSSCISNSNSSRKEQKQRAGNEFRSNSRKYCPRYQLTLNALIKLALQPPLHTLLSLDFLSHLADTKQPYHNTTNIPQHYTTHITNIPQHYTGHGCIQHYTEHYGALHKIDNFTSKTLTEKEHACLTTCRLNRKKWSSYLVSLINQWNKQKNRQKQIKGTENYPP